MKPTATPPYSSRASRRSAWRDRAVWRRTLLIGLPVGLLQAAINQGDHWLHHRVDGAVLLKTLLCPLVSCAIAFVSAIAAHHTKEFDPTSS
jgi:hypothetical protein